MKAIPLCAIIALTACAPVDESSPPVAGKCDAAAGQYAVGKAFTDTLAAEVKKKAGAATMRVIAPGTAVTMDYRDDRLNISHDEKKTITKIDCG
ncbi:MAG TPA: I78 family peptidase inhibitor [Sphingorhabdus sp.]|jgi:hypothetical protein|nr:I78 family peptidase inhibitor [Sphingorhabdus sp.]